MIQIQELRLGNYFLDDDGIPSRLIGFQPFDHSVRCDEKEGCELLLDFADGSRTELASNSGDCNPTPLTPSILEACGFKFDNGDAQSFDFNGLIIIKSGDFEGKFISVGHGLIIDGKRQCCYLSFLHELQNLYYALTKTELTYNQNQ